MNQRDDVWREFVGGSLSFRSARENALLDEIIRHRALILALETRLATLDAERAGVKWRLDRSEEVHAIMDNEVSLCHQCQREYENTVAERMEQWDRENPDPSTPTTPEASDEVL